MAETVERLAVLIEANTKQFERAMNRLGQTTNRAMNRSTRSVRSLDNRLKTLSRTVRSTAGAFGIAFGGIAFTRAIGNAIDSIADLGNTAINAGVSAERLQVFREHLEQNGASARDADDALRRFNRRLGEFINSSGGPAARALQELNIAVRDMNGNVRSSEDVFDDVVIALSQIEDQARVSAFAAQLFGDDAGPRLLQALRQGIQGMNETKARMEELGLIMDQELVDRGIAAADALQLAGEVIRTRFNIAVVSAIGVADDGGEAIVRFGNALGEFFDLVARNLPILFAMVGALGALALRLGPIGALIGGIGGAAAGFALQGAAAADAIERDLGALTALGENIDDLIRQSPDYIQARIGEVGADHEAARATAALLELRLASLRAQDDLMQGGPVGPIFEVREQIAATEQELRDQVALVQIYHDALRELGVLFNDAEDRTGAMDLFPALELPALDLPDLTRGAGAASRDLETLADKVAGVIIELREERDALARTNEEQRIYNALTEAGIDETSEFAEAIEREVRELIEAEERLRVLNEVLDGLKSATSDFFHTFQDGLEEGKTGVEALKDALESLRRKLLDLALDIAINMLFNAIAPALGSLIGRAGGGAVSPGVPYMVGERGPELFVPRSAGVIRRSDEAAGRGMGGGKGTVVQIINNSGQPAREERRRGPDGGELLRIVIGQVNSGIAEGRFDGAMASRFGARPRRITRG